MPAIFFHGFIVATVVVTVVLASASVATAVKLEAFAAEALSYSSQYSTSYGVAKAYGAPDLYPTTSDSTKGWDFSGSNVGVQYGDFRFDPPVYRLEAVQVYETYRPGSITLVSVAFVAANSTLAWYDIYNNAAGSYPGNNVARIFSVNATCAPPTGVAVSRARVEWNTNLVSGYQNIDALSLIGHTNAADAPVAALPTCVDSCAQQLTLGAAADQCVIANADVCVNVVGGVKCVCDAVHTGDACDEVLAWAVDVVSAPVADGGAPGEYYGKGNVVGPPTNLVIASSTSSYAIWRPKYGVFGAMHIEVTIPAVTDVRMVSLFIYEIYNAGTVRRVRVRDAATNIWHEVYNDVSPPAAATSARIFQPPLLCAPLFAVDRVRVDFETAASDAGNTSNMRPGIDAIGVSMASTDAKTAGSLPGACVDACAAQPLLCGGAQQGVCVNRHVDASTFCVCTDGYSGDNCETALAATETYTSAVLTWSSSKWADDADEAVQVRYSVRGAPDIYPDDSSSGNGRAFRFEYGAGSAGALTVQFEQPMFLGAAADEGNAAVTVGVYVYETYYAGYMTSIDVASAAWTDDNPAYIRVFAGDGSVGDALGSYVAVRSAPPLVCVPQGAVATVRVTWREDRSASVAVDGIGLVGSPSAAVRDAAVAARPASLRAAPPPCIDACEARPCEFNSTCIADGVAGTFACECLVGFDGPTCGDRIAAELFATEVLDPRMRVYSSDNAGVQFDVLIGEPVAYPTYNELFALSLEGVLHQPPRDVFVRLKYASPTFVSKVLLYERWSGGAATSISLRVPATATAPVHWLKVWSGVAVQRSTGLDVPATPAFECLPHVRTDGVWVQFDDAAFDAQKVLATVSVFGKASAVDVALNQTLPACVDACSSSAAPLCGNDGECVSYNGAAVCHCAAGFVGNECELAGERRMVATSVINCGTLFDTTILGSANNVLGGEYYFSGGNSYSLNTNRVNGVSFNTEWGLERTTKRNFVDLELDNGAVPLFITGVSVYETVNPGATFAIYVWQESGGGRGHWTNVWEISDTAKLVGPPTQLRKFTPTFDCLAASASTRVRIEFDVDFPGPPGFAFNDYIGIDTIDAMGHPTAVMVSPTLQATPCADVCATEQPCGVHGVCISLRQVSLPSGAQTFACECDDDWLGPRCDVNLRLARVLSIRQTSSAAFQYTSSSLTNAEELIQTADALRFSETWPRFSGKAYFRQLYISNQGKPEGFMDIALNTTSSGMFVRQVRVHSINSFHAVKGILLGRKSVGDSISFTRVWKRDAATVIPTSQESSMMHAPEFSCRPDFLVQFLRLEFDADSKSTLDYVSAHGFEQLPTGETFVPNLDSTERVAWPAGSLELDAERAAMTALAATTSAPACTDPCADSPCQNSNNCVAISQTAFECECSKLFSGDLCQYNVAWASSVLSSSPTLNAIAPLASRFSDDCIVGPADDDSDLDNNWDQFVNAAYDTSDSDPFDLIADWNSCSLAFCDAADLRTVELQFPRGVNATSVRVYTPAEQAGALTSVYFRRVGSAQWTQVWSGAELVPRTTSEPGRAIGEVFSYFQVPLLCAPTRMQAGIDSVRLVFDASSNVNDIEAKLDDPFARRMAAAAPHLVASREMADAAKGFNNRYGRFYDKRLEVESVRLLFAEEGVAGPATTCTAAEDACAGAGLICLNAGVCVAPLVDAAFCECVGDFHGQACEFAVVWATGVDATGVIVNATDDADVWFVDDARSLRGVTGRPDVYPATVDARYRYCPPARADDIVPPRAWRAPFDDAGAAFLTVEHAPGVVAGVGVYESLNPGAIVRILVGRSDSLNGGAVNGGGVWQEVWHRASLALPVAPANKARVFDISVDAANIDFRFTCSMQGVTTDRVRIELDTALVAGSNQIDAVNVRLVGASDDGLPLCTQACASAPCGGAESVCTSGSGGARVCECGSGRAGDSCDVGNAAPHWAASVRAATPAASWQLGGGGDEGVGLGDFSEGATQVGAFAAEHVVGRPRTVLQDLASPPVWRAGDVQYTERRRARGNPGVYAPQEASSVFSAARFVEISFAAPLLLERVYIVTTVTDAIIGAALGTPVDAAARRRAMGMRRILVAESATSSFSEVWSADNSLPDSDADFLLANVPLFTTVVNSDAVAADDVPIVFRPRLGCVPSSPVQTIRIEFATSPPVAVEIDAIGASEAAVGATRHAALCEDSCGGASGDSSGNGFCRNSGRCISALPTEAGGSFAKQCLCTPSFFDDGVVDGLVGETATCRRVSHQQAVLNARNSMSSQSSITCAIFGPDADTSNVQAGTDNSASANSPMSSVKCWGNLHFRSSTGVFLQHRDTATITEELRFPLLQEGVTQRLALPSVISQVSVTGRSNLLIYNNNDRIAWLSCVIVAVDGRARCIYRRTPIGGGSLFFDEINPAFVVADLSTPEHYFIETPRVIMLSNFCALDEDGRLLFLENVSLEMQAFFEPLRFRHIACAGPVFCGVTLNGRLICTTEELNVLGVENYGAEVLAVVRTSDVVSVHLEATRSVSFSKQRIGICITYGPYGRMMCADDVTNAYYRTTTFNFPRDINDECSVFVISKATTFEPDKQCRTDVNAPEVCSDSAQACRSRAQCYQLTSFDDEPGVETGGIDDVGVGDGFSCALMSGQVKCFGRSERAQLAVPTGSFVALTVGRRHACAVRSSDLEIACWGCVDFDCDGDSSVSSAAYARKVGSVCNNVVASVPSSPALLPCFGAAGDVSAGGCPLHRSCLLRYPHDDIVAAVTNSTTSLRCGDCATGFEHIVETGECRSLSACDNAERRCAEGYTCHIIGGNQQQCVELPILMSITGCASNADALQLSVPAPGTGAVNTVGVNSNSTAVVDAVNTAGTLSVGARSVTECPTTGVDADGAAVVVTLCGRAFGEAASLGVTIGVADCDVIAVTMPSTSMCPEQATCVLPQSSGFHRPITVSSFGASADANANSPTLSYAPPRIVDITGCAAAGCNRAGGDVITIEGTDLSASVRIFVGLLPCEPLADEPYDAAAQTRVVCRSPPGFGDRQVIFLQNGGEFTLEKTLSYEKCGVGEFSTASDGKLDTQTAVAAYSCKACVQGRFENVQRAQSGSCQPCSAGRFSDVNGKTVCELCIAGCFTAQAVATACSQCTAGTFSGAGAAACAECLEGRFAAAGGLSECVACPPGSSSSRRGMSACELCSSGRANDAFGQPQCSTCAVGTFSARNGSRKCVGCPRFAKCDRGDGKATTLRGSWRLKLDDTSVSLSTTNATATRRLMQFSASLGFSSNGNGVAFYPCPPGHCLENDRCTAGRKPADVNPLCGECLDGYAEWANQCVECTSTNWGFIFLAILLGLAYVAITFALSSRRDSTGSFKSFMYWVGMCECVCVCLCVYVYVCVGVWCGCLLNAYKLFSL
jgi:hypothetical protein